MKRIVVWATVQYAVHVDGATIHVTGPDERQVEFGDGTTSFATLSGGEGYINSTVTVNAPDFVTMTGKSVNEMKALIRAQQTAIVAQQVEIAALKQFVGMALPPLVPPSTPPLSPTHLCGAEECVARCDSLYPSESNDCYWMPCSRYCAKGCVGNHNGNRDDYNYTYMCQYPPDERYTECVALSNTGGCSSSSSNQAVCRVACDYWG